MRFADDQLIINTRRYLYDECGTTSGSDLLVGNWWPEEENSGSVKDNLQKLEQELFRRYTLDRVVMNDHHRKSARTTIVASRCGTTKDGVEVSATAKDSRSGRTESALAARTQAVFLCSLSVRSWRPCWQAISGAGG
ncbi:MAG: hypothetical protein IPK44_03400 [Candidatus Accumulibacter sp.]|uniref:hypothetical protein n=1 Tax=Accumulibacter sp. TaxID=2053492 RepID=UPI002589D5FC|nr:hypothetical protein [Accumulibacter sp.]MBK8113647.1 hypothetical protein [Accumulibacter sp.]